MPHNSKIALVLVGCSLSVLCLTLAHTIRFAFPFLSVSFTQGFFIGVGLVGAVVSVVCAVKLAADSTNTLDAQ